SPCRRWWRRLVTSKNSSFPSTTSHRVSIPAPRRYPRSDWSISATPPPSAVVLMCQRVLPLRARAAPSSASANRRYRSGSRSSSNRSGEVGEISTSSTGTSWRTQAPAAAKHLAPQHWKGRITGMRVNATARVSDIPRNVTHEPPSHTHNTRRTLLPDRVGSATGANQREEARHDQQADPFLDRSGHEVPD